MPTLLAEDLPYMEAVLAYFKGHGLQVTIPVVLCFRGTGACLGGISSTLDVPPAGR